MIFCMKHKAKYSEEHMLCEECLEDAALISAANMGQPDFFLCGRCSHEFLPEDIEQHILEAKC